MTEVVRKMKQFRFKKVASILLAIAMVFTTLTLVSTTESQAATKAIKIKNVTGTTKSLNVGKTFTIKTNYTASKLTFKSSKPAIALVTSKGKITAKKAGTAKITITLKANKKVKKAFNIKVKKGATNNTNNDQKQEDTRYYEKTIRELKNGMMEEKYYPDTGKSDYRIAHIDKGQTKGYQSMSFTISGASPKLVPIGHDGMIKNDEVMLFMWHGGKGEDLTKMTDADILKWWEETSDPSQVQFSKSEDKNYIRVYFEAGVFTNGDGDTFISRNALIQKKDTNELYGIRYDSKEGTNITKEDVYKILDSIEIGGFTADDLRKQM